MTAGLTSVAFALAPRWPVVRVWTSAASTVISGCLVLVVIGSSATVTAGTLAVAGVLAVVLAEVRRSRLRGHLGVVGELLAVAGWVVAIGVPVDGHRTPAIGAVTTVAVLGAFGTSAAIEALRGSSVSDLLVRIRHRLSPTPLPAPDQAAAPAPRRAAERTAACAWPPWPSPWPLRRSPWSLRSTPPHCWPPTRMDHRDRGRGDDPRHGRCAPQR